MRAPWLPSLALHAESLTIKGALTCRSPLCIPLHECMQGACIIAFGLIPFLLLRLDTVQQPLCEHVFASDSCIGLYPVVTIATV